MRVSIQLLPGGQIREYQMARIPGTGEVLDLTDADDLPWTHQPLYVAQIVNEIGREPEAHRVTLRVLPLSEVPDYPGRGCTACLRGV